MKVQNYMINFDSKYNWIKFPYFIYLFFLFVVNFVIHWNEKKNFPILKEGLLF